MKGSVHFKKRPWGAECFLPSQSSSSPRCLWKEDPQLKAQPTTAGCYCAPCSAHWFWSKAPRWTLKNCRAWLPHCCLRTGPVQPSSCSRISRLKPRLSRMHRQRVWQTLQLQEPLATIQVSPSVSHNWLPIMWVSKSFVRRWTKLVAREDAFIDGNGVTLVALLTDLLVVCFGERC